MFKLAYRLEKQDDNPHKCGNYHFINECHNAKMINHIFFFSFVYIVSDFFLLICFLNLFFIIKIKTNCVGGYLEEG